MDMAYDHRLADDVRARIGSRSDLTEREMFGGIAFMIRGNMAVGVSGDGLMVRVGKEAHDDLVTEPGARTFDMSGRPMRGWLAVSTEGIASDASLDSWVARGISYAESLPPK
jgi:TfoX/Sxy family transcriptional regulator of competence genes